MTYIADRQADLIDVRGDAPEARPGTASGLPAAYDAWRTATPPEYAEREERPPVRVHLLSGGACGRVTPPWLCTLPEGHHRDGRLCNTLDVSRARLAELIAANRRSR